MVHDRMPETEDPQEQNNPPSPACTLWDIATPEEVAYSIIGVYPDPLKELARRERFSRRQRNPVNLRFWAEVRRVIEATLDGRPAS